MKTFLPAFALAAMCCSAVPAWADGPDELWEIATKMEMAGMPAMPARTSQVCHKKGQFDPTKSGAKDKDSDCQVTDKQQSGNKTSWKMVCTKPKAMTGTGEVTHTGDTYQGTIAMTADGMDIKQTFSGKKVGSCTYEEPSKKIEAMQAQSKAAMAKECDKQIEKLEPMMVFGGANLPESALYCKDRKADFCAQTTKVTQQMRDPAAYADANKKYPNWRDAAKACTIDPATISAPACKAAVDKKDWPFVGENCPVEGRAVALQNCTGMDYTARMSSPYRDVCNKYGADLAKKQVNADKPATDDKPATPEAKPSVGDKIKDGASSLKKLLKF
jgi:Protein of unknown function (DUF3617)